MMVAAVALAALAGCTEAGVIHNQPGTQAEANCAAGGFAPGSQENQDCVEALKRGKLYAGPNVGRSGLNSLYYQACVAAKHPEVGCGCLVSQLEAYGLTDRAMRSLLINAGIIWQPPVSQFYDVTPINLAAYKCRLRFP
jgi:hypothetical protein